jgi:predicted MFS family arabinose efflux permease
MTACRTRTGEDETMAREPERKRQDGREGRMVALVIAGVALAWMGGQWLGRSLGWEARYVFLIDFLALAGFLWAMIVTYQIWRRRRND